MRITHVYRTYFPDSQGGLEEVIRQTCINTKKLGADCRVLSLSGDSNPEVIERAEATVFRARRHFEFASCSVSLTVNSLFKELTQWSDIVHYHFPWPWADYLHFITAMKKPSLLTYHSDIVRQQFLGKFYAPLMKRFLGSVNRIACTSPNYFATSDVLGRYAEKVDVIPIGLDESSYPEASNEVLQSVKKRYGQNFFLFVGVLRYYKGLHILLEAIQDAPYKVIIVGSGPTEQELKKQSEELGLANVVFTGHVTDETKVALFELSRAVVFPSYLRAEAFGVTLLEGAMYGRPLISTEVGSGTSHVNIDHQTGFVVPPASAKALRHAMDQLHFRPEMAELMGRKARRRYEQLFTGRLMGQRYHNVYQKLLGLEPETAFPLAVGSED